MTEADLRRWMAECGPRLLALSAGICRDRHRAEEIVQEAFVRLWHTPPEAGEIAFRSWLRRVVTNLSINALQRTKRAAPLPTEGWESGDHRSLRPEQILSSREETARIHSALDRLDATKRAILMLRAVEELSYEEIAEALEIPVGTVMSRLNRARAALAEELDEPLDEARVPDSLPFRRPRSAQA